MHKSIYLYKYLFISLTAVAAVFSVLAGELLISTTLFYVASLSSTLDFRISVHA